MNEFEEVCALRPILHVMATNQLQEQITTHTVTEVKAPLKSLGLAVFHLESHGTGMTKPHKKMASLLTPYTYLVICFLNENKNKILKATESQNGCKGKEPTTKW